MDASARTKLRVIIIDDHPIYREGLRAVLGREADLHVVGEAANAADAYTIAEVAKPDVALVEAMLPAIDGFAVTRELRRRVPRCKMLILARPEVQRIAELALASGASGYALKTQPVDQLVLAIRTVGRDERYLPAPASSPAAVDGTIAILSAREREIFDLAIRGLSNDNMAEDLKISVKTVETHRAHINRKLSVHSTAELVRFAARHGLLPR